MNTLQDWPEDVRAEVERLTTLELEKIRRAELARTKDANLRREEHHAEVSK